MSGIATSVIPLLSEWEKYLHQYPDGDIPGFATWILAHQQPATPTPSAPPPPPPPAPVPAPATYLPTTAQAGLLIARVHRIITMLTKPMIKSLGFTKDMEFAVLVHVAVMDYPNKKELCRELLIENSTGVEITKRLAKKGIIAERPDANDRRSARLSITEKGKKILMQGAGRFDTFHSTFFDALDNEEKQELVTFLARINEYQSSRINHQPDGQE